MKKVKNKGRQGPGKHPTRVPKKTVTPLPGTTSKKQTLQHGRSKFRPKPPPSAHKMKTRARSSKFQFMNLPPELRCKIYEHLFSSAGQPLNLSDFRLPKALYWSHAVREEALPVFFASSTFTATFRCNWCVRNHHWHSDKYLRYNETGIFDLSPLLGTGNLALPKEAVRFHNVDFSVRCVCCVQVLEIGFVQLRIVDRKPCVTAEVTSGNLETRWVWPRFVKDIEEEVKKIGGRSVFNGFTVGDLETLAMCFRQDVDNAHNHI